MSSIKGKIAQVIGPIVDVSFEKGMSLPKKKEYEEGLIKEKSNAKS